MQTFSQSQLNLKLSDHRHQGDVLADKVYASTDFKIYDFLKSEKKFNCTSQYPELRDVVTDIFQTYELADQDLIHAAQLFFEKYASEISGILGLYSLPYCYAGEAGAKILTQSKYLVENPEVRLRETGEFLFAVCRTNGFQEEGDGLFQILRTRLMHAHIRRVSNRTDEIPVNIEDMLGTNLSFSLIVIRGLKKMGIYPSDGEISSYMYLWKCIGRMLGIASELLPQNSKEASVLERSIRRRQFRENDDGKQLTNSLVDYYQGNPFFQNIEPAEVIAEFVGEEVAPMIGLKRKPGITRLSLDALRVKNYFSDFSSRNFEREMRRMERLANS